MLKRYFANVPAASMPRRLTKGPLDVEEYGPLSLKRTFY